MTSGARYSGVLGGREAQDGKSVYVSILHTPFLKNKWCWYEWLTRTWYKSYQEQPWQIPYQQRHSTPFHSPWRFLFRGLTRGMRTMSFRRKTINWQLQVNETHLAWDLDTRSSSNADTWMPRSRKRCRIPLDECQLHRRLWSWACRVPTQTTSRMVKPWRLGWSCCSSCFLRKSARTVLKRGGRDEKGEALIQSRHQQRQNEPSVEETRPYLPPWLS